MARPTTIKDEDILRAARETFLEHGMQATTADVAKRAGVSEGILFHRFGSKAALFQASMTPPDAGDMLAALALASRVGRGTMAENLGHILETLIDFFGVMMPMIMMGWSNRNEGGFPKEFETATPPPVKVTHALASYFEAEMDAGRLRRVDSEILAHNLGGAAWSYVFFRLLAKQSGARLPLPKGAFVREVTDQMLAGVAPRNAHASADPKPGKRRRIPR